jgi:hypothetical protein
VTRPEDRPDPLAPLPERPRPGTPPPGADLTLCSHHPNGVDRCATPPSVILWIGCTRGEHAGPMAYCAAHATPVAHGPVHCAQCGGQVKVMKITSMDGESTVWVPRPGPPADLWKQVAPGGYPERHGGDSDTPGTPGTG